MAGILGGWDRRAEEWQLQANLAARELQQLDQQILAAEIRLAIVRRGAAVHEMQMEHATEVADHLRDKYTNEELFEWMSTQLSTLYFQAYQLAYDLAKRAERAYRFELGLEDSAFIRFGHWDSRRKGLLAGERLQHDLRRMDAAYLHRDEREYELTKHVSLAVLDPGALLRLRETGECDIDLPEVHFDRDYPGQFLRRIRTVGISVPCVTGPYAGVNCTLTLTGSSVRRTPAVQAEGTGADYPRKGDADPRFADAPGAIRSIVTSSGREDYGMFNPGGRDERLQPFEGAGAVSTWHVTLDPLRNPGVPESMADIVLHLQYTARDGGAPLAAEARAWLAGLPSGGVRLVSAAGDFPAEWLRFRQPAETATRQEFAPPLSTTLMPRTARGRKLRIDSLVIALKLADDKQNKEFEGTGLPVFAAAPDAAAPVAGALTSKKAVLNATPLTAAPLAAAAELTATDRTWVIGVRSGDLASLPPALVRTVTVKGKQYSHLKPEAVEDLFVLCAYTVLP